MPHHDRKSLAVLSLTLIGGVVLVMVSYGLSRAIEARIGTPVPESARRELGSETQEQLTEALDKCKRNLSDLRQRKKEEAANSLHRDERAHNSAMHGRAIEKMRTRAEAAGVENTLEFKRICKSAKELYLRKLLRKENRNLQAVLSRCVKAALHEHQKGVGRPLSVKALKRLANQSWLTKSIRTEIDRLIKEAEAAKEVSPVKKPRAEGPKKQSDTEQVVVPRAKKKPQKKPPAEEATKKMKESATDDGALEKRKLSEE